MLFRSLKTYEDHPFFTLLREHQLPIALASDDPQQGGIDYKDQVKLLAGITYKFRDGFQPLTAEELVICNLNAIHAAFCEATVKPTLVAPIRAWMNEHHVTVAHPLLAK